MARRLRPLVRPGAPAEPTFTSVAPKASSIEERNSHCNSQPTSPSKAPALLPSLSLGRRRHSANISASSPVPSAPADPISPRGTWGSSVGSPRAPQRETPRSGRQGLAAKASLRPLDPAGSAHESSSTSLRHTSSSSVRMEYAQSEPIERRTTESNKRRRSFDLGVVNGRRRSSAVSYNLKSAAASRFPADEGQMHHAADHDERDSTMTWGALSDEGVDGAWWAREQAEDNLEYQQKSRKEIDDEFNSVLENWEAIKDTGFRMPQIQAARADASSVDERVSAHSRHTESFADRVVRMEDNKAFLDEAAAAAENRMDGNSRRRSGVFDEGPRGQVEQDVTRSVERVRAKLKAVLVARKDFLEGSEQDLLDQA